MARRGWLVADIAFKAVLAALLLFAVTHQDWDRFADKAMIARAVLYPVLVGLVPLVWLVRSMRAVPSVHRQSVGLVPLVWLVRSRFSATSYPAAAAFLLTVPFVVDCAGNALNLYDSIDVFDDVCHLVNWAMLSAAIGLVLVRQRELAPWVVAGLVIGFGGVTAIVWEIGEYGAFILNTPERDTAYRDTIGDMSLGLTGSAVAALVCAIGATRRGRPAAIDEPSLSSR
jgi:hypothetical protein